VLTLDRIFLLPSSTSDHGRDLNAIIRDGLRWFKRYFRKAWESRGSGFYGFVGALTFVYLEALDLAGDLAGIADIRIDLGWVIGFVVSNLVDAVMNLVRAALWPLEWIQRFGITGRSLLLLAGAYLIYRLIRPTVLRLLSEDDPEPEPRPEA
jgi:hypothetical protein